MRHIRSSAVKYGRNRDIDTWDDNRYVRCARCGWVCNLDRDLRGQRGSRQGWGITEEDQGGWLDEPNGWFIGEWFVRTQVDPVVSSGCPQCGTLMYDR